MRAEIASEPDLAMLVQACARSHDLGGAASEGLRCPEDDGQISAEIIEQKGAEEPATRQPELHAYVRSPFGPIVSLARHDVGYCAILDKGMYFVGNCQIARLSFG